MTAPVAAPGRRSDWTELVAHVPGRRINAADAFAGHLRRARVGRRRCSGCGSCSTTAPSGCWPSTRRCTASSPAATPSSRHDLVRFDYESLVTPASVYEEDVRTGERRLLKQTPVLDGFDPAPLRHGAHVGYRAGRRAGAGRPRLAPRTGAATARRRWCSTATAPTSCRWRRGSRSPACRCSTGAWCGRSPIPEAAASSAGSGTCTASSSRSATRSPTSSPPRSTSWRRDGPRRTALAIRGGSAGGLLVGASMAMRPDLFAAVVAEVPFVDVVNTMHDETLPLTVTEWEEWGDPRDPTFEAYMASYSPYENVAAGRLPGHVGHGRAQRPAGELPRAGQVGGQAPRHGHRPAAAAAAHRAGRGTRRAVGPLRRRGARKRARFRSC